MTRVHSHINSAKEILSQYKGPEPFSTFSKQYFTRFKKFGSRDRKIISHLCYCFFRLGKWRQELDPEERILTGLWLCSEQPNEILAELKPAWNEKTGIPTREKINLLKEDFSNDEVFPWIELNSNIDREAFVFSHFRQPELFLRLRPGFDQHVKQKLSASGISFSSPNPNCLALPNSTKLDDIIELDKEAVIQDLNSQRVAEFFPTQVANAWDCCAASGGKSILLKDYFPKVNLTISDVRESILINLQKRFERAGIKNYKLFVADLSGESQIPSRKVGTNNQFDLVICDAPCTGSGTWSRTPEQLFYFEPSKIEYYQQLQRSILRNVVQAIKEEGHLLYCTCSVFRKENEDNLDWISKEFNMIPVRSALLKGYDKKADNLYVTLLRKQS